jgi:two-component system, chemotaxis family, chemotaxis protein CheY
MRNRAAELQPMSASPESANYRILVVEDDDENREFLRALLESESFLVATARDGREALEWLRGHPSPDLVLLDLEMPRMNGWEFLQAAGQAALLRGTRIMILTGRAQDIRVLDWVSKPAMPDRLVERILHHIRVS